MAHQRAQDAFAALLANVRADQLGGPTPCSEWTINDLIEHVVGGNEAIGPGGWLDGAGRPSPDLLVAADDVLDQIVDRPLRAGRGAAELVSADVGQERGERVLSALVSHQWVHCPAFRG
ncbi:TIGR03086 family protein [Mycobacterium tuberculosis]|nr:TIGR03086 family protein [Mycobacterium tuberculosis]